MSDDHFTKRDLCFYFMTYQEDHRVLSLPSTFIIHLNMLGPNIQDPNLEEQRKHIDYDY